MATREQLIEDFADHKYATGEKFARLINSMKVVQEPVTDPAASGTSLSFIASIEQNADGKIAATKKNVQLVYAQIQGKPQINGHTLNGDMSLKDLGIINQVQLNDGTAIYPDQDGNVKLPVIPQTTNTITPGSAFVPTADAVDEALEEQNLLVPKANPYTATQKYNASANIKDRSAVVADVTGEVQALGYKVLSHNASFVSQVVAANTIYEIRDEFDLESGSVTIPTNCTLKFEGGTVVNGTIVGDNTVVVSPPVKVFSDDCALSGTWVGEGFVEWFGDDFEKCINVFKSIRLLPGKTYELLSTLKMPAEASIVGNGSSTIHTDGTFDVVWMGYKCTINGVIFKTDTPCNTIVVCFEQIAATRQIDIQTTSLNYKGIDSHILIENVIIQSKGSANNAQVYAIKVISDGASNGISGFWGVTIRKVSIGGDYYYGVTFDNGTCVNNVWANPWLTSCLVEDVTMANVRNCFFIGQTNKGTTSGTAKVGFIVFRRCQAQRNWNIGYLQQAFFEIKKATHIFIEECNPQDWYKTDDEVDINNNGEAGEYRVDRVQCSDIVLTTSVGTVKLNGTGILNPVAIFGSYSSWKAFTTYTKQLTTDTWIPKNGQYFTIGELWDLPDGNYTVLYKMYSYMGLAGSGNSSYFAFTKFSMIGGGGTVMSLIIGRFVIDGVYASTRLVTMTITATTSQDSGLESHWCYASLNPLKKVAYSSSERPSILTSSNTGAWLYDTTLKKPIWWSGTAWVEEDGEAAGIKRTGTSAQRPSPTNVGFKYFDTTLSKPIYWNGTAWVDADGETVGLQVSDTSVLIGAAADSTKTVSMYYGGSTAPAITVLNSDDSANTWLTATLSNNTLTLTAAANTTSAPRGAKVLVTLGDELVIINVIQTQTVSNE